jgi:hypothetical protein
MVPAPGLLRASPATAPVLLSIIAPALFYLRPSVGLYILYGPGQPLDRFPVSPPPCSRAHRPLATDLVDQGLVGSDHAKLLNLFTFA